MSVISDLISIAPVLQPTKIELILQGLIQSNDLQSRSNKVTMQYLNDFMKINMDNREMHLLEQELLLNGYIRANKGQLSITNAGKKFLKGEISVAPLTTIQIQERLIPQNTLETGKNDNLMIGLFFATILLTIIGFIIGVA